MIKNTANSDPIQSPTNTSTSLSSNPFSINTTTSNISKTTDTNVGNATVSAAGSINPPSADSTGDTYIIKKENVLN